MAMTIDPPTDAALPSGEQRAPSTNAEAPNAENVAKRAFELYQERGGGHGRDLEDWLRAERELREGPTG
jgi:hypothetical protein